MPRIIRYWAHDPIGNSEGILAGYEPDALKAAQDRGIIFIAELDDGTRLRVDAVADILDPQPAQTALAAANDAAADTSGDDARRRLRDAIARLTDLTKGTGK